MYVEERDSETFRVRKNNLAFSDSTWQTRVILFEFTFYVHSSRAFIPFIPSSLH